MVAPADGVLSCSFSGASVVAGSDQAYPVWAEGSCQNSPVKTDGGFYMSQVKGDQSHRWRDSLKAQLAGDFVSERNVLVHCICSGKVNFCENNAATNLENFRV